MTTDVITIKIKMEISILAKNKQCNLFYSLFEAISDYITVVSRVENFAIFPVTSLLFTKPFVQIYTTVKHDFICL